MLTRDEILKKVLKFDCDRIEITGGEPLLQPESADLAEDLIRQGKTVLVETNGTQNIDLLPPAVIRIMDLKCPGSGEVDQTDWHNIDRLRIDDNVKFVISHREDFDWAVKVTRQYRLWERTQVLYAPAFGLLPPRVLAQWLLELSLPIRLNLQLHKYIWEPNKRGV